MCNGCYVYRTRLEIAKALRLVYFRGRLGWVKHWEDHRRICPICGEKNMLYAWLRFGNRLTRKIVPHACRECRAYVKDYFKIPEHLDELCHAWAGANLSNYPRGDL